MIEFVSRPATIGEALLIERAKRGELEAMIGLLLSRAAPGTPADAILNTLMPDMEALVARMLEQFSVGESLLKLAKAWDGEPA